MRSYCILLKQILEQMLRLKFFLNYKFGPIEAALFVLSGLAAGAFWFGQVDKPDVGAQLTQLTSAHHSNKLELSKATIALEIERNTIVEMKTTLLRQQSELIEQQQALRFYQKVMAPEDTENGVRIEDVNLEAGISANHYRFEVLLAQLEKRKLYIKGEVRLAVIGSEQGQPKTIVLKKEMLSGSKLKFSFLYFQSLEAEFVLPADFIPEQLEVRLKMSKRRGQKAANSPQVYRWKEILNVPLKPILDGVDHATE